MPGACMSALALVLLVLYLARLRWGTCKLKKHLSQLQLTWIEITIASLCVFVVVCLPLAFAANPVLERTVRGIMSDARESIAAVDVDVDAVAVQWRTTMTNASALATTLARAVGEAGSAMTGVLEQVEEYDGYRRVV